MQKTDVLILLVNSLTKAEKRKFRTWSRKSDYVILFDLIGKNKGITSGELKSLFLKEKPGASFEITVGYLYKLLLDSLLALRKEQDNHYILLTKILEARVLFEKSLFEEALNLLEQVKAAAEKYENHYAYLYAARLQLEYLPALNFPDISETELVNKHFQINEVLKKVRVINELSSLYELLKHRIIHQGNIRSEKQKEKLYDLVFSEMSIITSSKTDSFEIKKLHQLFQSNYLIHVGDYQSALQSYHELNRLFEDNKHLWANPPVYYVMALEGILDNLRSIGKYDDMPYFIRQLKAIHHSSINFSADITALTFLYELFPLLDCGNFRDALVHLGCYKDNVLEKKHLLSLNRQAEIFLYEVLVYFGCGDLKKARKTISQVIIRGKSFYSLPLYRTIRLVHLMIRYETGDFETISYETRSIKRELSKHGKAYGTEHLMLQFLNKPVSGSLPEQVKKDNRKMLSELEKLRNNLFEKQILKLFDFTAWIESKLRNLPLTKVLSERRC
jgi:tetratricopeptide (TPR) repeat protein